MVDLVCASHGARGTASKWKVYVGDALWRGFQNLAAERVSQKRSSEVRTVAHATEHGLPRFHGATNATSLQDAFGYFEAVGQGVRFVGDAPALMRWLGWGSNRR